MSNERNKRTGAGEARPLLPPGVNYNEVPLTIEEAHELWRDHPDHASMCPYCLQNVSVVSKEDFDDDLELDDDEDRVSVDSRPSLQMNVGTPQAEILTVTDTSLTPATHSSLTPGGHVLGSSSPQSNRQNLSPLAIRRLSSSGMGSPFNDSLVDCEKTKDNV